LENKMLDEYLTIRLHFENHTILWLV
jgi:hypothetical protein